MAIMKIRKRLKSKEIEFLGLPKKKTNRYTLTQDQWDSIKVKRNLNSVDFFDLSAWTKKGTIMNIDEFCETHNLNRGDIQSWRLCTHTKIPTYNITFKENKEVESNISYDFINDIVSRHIKPVNKSVNKLVTKSVTFDRLVISDIHIGMNPNENNQSLYGLDWNEKEVEKRKKELIDFCIKNKKGDTLNIDELGDFLDGWDGETTRKGHHLPQNMDNETAFDVAVNFKVSIVDELINHYYKINLNNICNDNHSGSFGYVVNSAVKSILELKYKGFVTVNNYRKFINHYYFGNHCFLISHGKDCKHLKFGFKPQLDPKQIEKIDQYCKQNNIYKNCDFIEFSKGDSHQMIMDYATSDDFDYCNYPAFSPSSDWVQTNFKKGRSGFVLYNIDYKDNIKNSLVYWFK